MARPRPTAKEREWEVREEAQRKAKLSVRVGIAGVALLFLCGVGVWLAPKAILPFLFGMVAGILLIVVALLLVWRSPMRLRLDEQTKIY
jgi:hypothetical protein